MQQATSQHAPPPGFPFGAKPRRASRRPPACSLLFPPGGRGETLHTNSGAPGRGCGVESTAATALPGGVLPSPAPPPPSRSTNFHSLLASPGGPPLVIFSPLPPSLAGPGRAAAQPVSAAPGAAGGAGEARPHSPYIGRRVGRSRLRGSGARRRRRRRQPGGEALGEVPLLRSTFGGHLAARRRAGLRAAVPSYCSSGEARGAREGAGVPPPCSGFSAVFPGAREPRGRAARYQHPPSSGAAGEGRGANPA